MRSVALLLETVPLTAFQDEAAYTAAQGLAAMLEDTLLTVGQPAYTSPRQ